jgi:hypothetical protein
MLILFWLVLAAALIPVPKPVHHGRAVSVDEEI